MSDFKQEMIGSDEPNKSKKKDINIQDEKTKEEQDDPSFKEAVIEQKDTVKNIKNKVNSKHQNTNLSNMVVKSSIWSKVAAIGACLSLLMIIAVLLTQLDKNYIKHELTTVLKIEKKMYEQNEDKIQNSVETIAAIIKRQDDKFSQLEKRQFALNKNMQQLNENLSKIQQNVTHAVSSQKKIDLSVLQDEIKKIQASVHSYSKQDKRLKEKVSPVVPQSENKFIEYVGVSPTGGILHLYGGGSSKYITVKAGDKTSFGKVSFLSSKKIIINNKTYLKGE